MGIDSNYHFDNVLSALYDQKPVTIKINEPENKPMPVSEPEKKDYQLEIRMVAFEAEIRHIESSVTEIKQEVKEIRKDMRSDFRWIMSAISGAFLVLMAVIAHGFKWF